jgi:hypothetical protein
MNPGLLRIQLRLVPEPEVKEAATNGIAIGIGHAR